MGGNRVRYTRADSGGGPTPPPASGTSVLLVESEWQKSVMGASEMLVMEASVDFGFFTTPNLIPRLAALTYQTAGSGEYRVRVGGTSGVADGLVVLTLTTANASFPNVPDQLTGGAFPNPLAPRLVKLTANATTTPAIARIRGYEILFVPAP